MNLSMHSIILPKFVPLSILNSSSPSNSKTTMPLISNLPNSRSSAFQDAHSYQIPYGTMSYSTDTSISTKSSPDIIRLNPTTAIHKQSAILTLASIPEGAVGNLLKKSVSMENGRSHLYQIHESSPLHVSPQMART